MGIINFFGFEEGALSDLNGTSGTVSISSTYAKTGVYSLKVNPTTTGTGFASFRKPDSALAPVGSLDLSTSYVSFDFYYVTKPTSGREHVAFWYSTANAAMCELCLNSSGNLVFYDYNPTLVATGSTVLNSGTWYRIDIKYTTGTTATYEVKINGTVEIGSTCSGRADNMGTFYLGKVTNRDSNSIEFYYDNLIIDDAAYPSTTTVVQIMSPDADGNYTDGVQGGSCGGTDDYSWVDEIPVSGDSGYLQVMNGSKASVSLESCANAGVSGTIVSAKWVCWCYRSSAPTSKTLIYISADYLSAEFTLPIGGISPRYVVSNVSPATSTAWTTSEIDGASFGFQGTSATAYSRWYSGHLMVLFTPSASGGVPKQMNNILRLINA